MKATIDQCETIYHVNSQLNADVTAILASIVREDLQWSAIALIRRLDRHVGAVLAAPRVGILRQWVDTMGALPVGRAA